MPAARASRPKRFNYRKLPLWAQWALPFSVAAVLVIAMIVFVEHESNDVPFQAHIGAKELAIEAQQADAEMRQTQAPHSATLSAGVAPVTGLKHAITIWLSGQMKLGLVDGPLNGISCVTTAGSSSTRIALKCELTAANVNYPFYGVVTPATRQITYCQRVAYAPQYGLPLIPLSRRCLGG